MNFRNSQTKILVDAFKQAGIFFTLAEVVDDTHPHANAWDDFLMSRHGNPQSLQAFVFRNEDGGKLFWVAPHEHPTIKYRVLATHRLHNFDDAYAIVCEYSLLFGGDLVV
jgi:hypothetical protein